MFLENSEFNKKVISNKIIEAKKKKVVFRIKLPHRSIVVCLLLFTNEMWPAHVLFIENSHWSYFSDRRITGGFGYAQRERGAYTCVSTNESNTCSTENSFPS